MIQNEIVTISRGAKKAFSGQSTGLVDDIEAPMVANACCRKAATTPTTSAMLYSTLEKVMGIMIG